MKAEVEVYRTRDVFTPTTPARVAFVERNTVNDRLVNALTTPGKQIVVYGHSGSGKTTLLVNKLNQVYEQHLTTRCMKGMKFEQIILDGFDQLDSFYTSERTAGKKATVSADLIGSYLTLQTKLSASHTSEAGQKEVRILPPQLTPQALGRFMGAAGYCWVLEDFHKVDETEKAKLSQLMKIFMDLADEYSDLKIVALGAVDTARQVVDYDPEMRNRVAEIHVDLMTEKEIEAVIEKGEKALNITISNEVKRLISGCSNGLASVCHHLCLYMCNTMGIVETGPLKLSLTKASFDNAVKMYAEEASDSIKSAFDKALKQRRNSKFDNASLVINALCKFKNTGASRIQLLKKIEESVENYPSKNLSYCLSKLVTAEYGGVLRYDSNSGQYSFSDPFYRAFALAQFREHDELVGGNDVLAEFVKYLNIEFKKNIPGKVQVAVRAIRKG
jgi:energy-coupling factor transporter ATP-binding protein EcfA2